MKTKDGVRLWGKDFQPHSSFRRKSDTVKFRAEDVAKALAKDMKQGSKKQR